MLIDDKSVSLRLREQPEFLLRLDEFLPLHNPKAMPALVVQARPARCSPRPIDVHMPDFHDKLLKGSAELDTWWNCACSTARVTSIFHGVAASPVSDERAWALEAHRDGHFIAGIWKFPDYEVDGVEVRAVASFYTHFFRDFLSIVCSLLGDCEVNPPYVSTATLVGADQLHFAAPGSGSTLQLFAAPLAVKNLQFPVYSVDTSERGWPAAADEMGKALCGAYGSEAAKRGASCDARR